MENVACGNAGALLEVLGMRVGSIAIMINATMPPKRPAAVQAPAPRPFDSAIFRQAIAHPIQIIKYKSMIPPIDLIIFDSSEITIAQVIYEKDACAFGLKLRDENWP